MKIALSLIKYIQKNFKEEQIQKFIIPMLYIENYPREIISKFFARMYTEETSFYRLINIALMKKEKDYDTFVKVMYEGLYMDLYSIVEMIYYIVVVD